MTGHRRDTQETEAPTTVPALMTADEVAKAFFRGAVTAGTIGNWRRQGLIGAVRLGGRYFFTAEIVADFLDRNTTTATCPNSRTSESARSEPIGSPKSQDATATPMRGAEPGTIAVLDRQSVSALARATFRPQAKP